MKATLSDALASLHSVGDVSSDLKLDGVVEAECWWYIPIESIGCLGYIVDKADLSVDALGSGVPLDTWFWAHDRGIVGSPVDFSITDHVDVNTVTLRQIVSRFRRFIVRTDGSEGYTWYFAHELDAAITRQFPTFRRHIVTGAVVAIREAHDRGELSFHCVKSQNA